MKTLKEISAIVLALKEVEWGFIQQTESLEQFNAVRNASGGFDKGQRYKTEFRCFLCTSKGSEEAIADSAWRAAIVVLHELGITTPQALLDEEQLEIGNSHGGKK